MIHLEEWYLSKDYSPLDEDQGAVRQAVRVQDEMESSEEATPPKKTQRRTNINSATSTFINVCTTLLTLYQNSSWCTQELQRTQEKKTHSQRIKGGTRMSGVIVESVNRILFLFKFSSVGDLGISIIKVGKSAQKENSSDQHKTADCVHGSDEH